MNHGLAEELVAFAELPDDNKFAMLQQARKSAMRRQMKGRAGASTAHFAMVRESLAFSELPAEEQLSYLNDQRKQAMRGLRSNGCGTLAKPAAAVVSTAQAITQPLHEGKSVLPKGDIFNDDDYGPEGPS
jgi:hypothetical protein